MQKPNSALEKRFIHTDIFKSRIIVCYKILVSSKDVC